MLKKRVPTNVNISSTNLMLPPQCSASQTSINSKGSTLNLSPNSRMPWKIVLLGEAGVGKTSLVKQFLNHCYSPNYNPTVEDSYWHNINLPDGLNQCLEILDTSGFYQFPAMKELNVKMGTAFILVFDLTKYESLQSLIETRQYIINVKGSENVPILLIGNKCDAINYFEPTVVANNDNGSSMPAETDTSSLSSAILNETISVRAAKLASTVFKSKYLETSAKMNINVAKMFDIVVNLILRELDELRQQQESANMGQSVNRRNSSISFVRRISVGTVNKMSEQSRRYSEPVVNENQASNGANKKNKKTTSSSGKDSSSILTPTSSTRRKQKYCTIS